jgi:hypothetical protein
MFGRNCPTMLQNSEDKSTSGFPFSSEKGLTVRVPTMLQNSEDKSTSGIPFSSEKG